ncbi:MAG: DNA mismatch repair protein MutL, partial [Dehalococcoidia bacterium]|nr:DNA mismatch repair protein MutL [Dehalococcoidia bacterium]
RSAASEARRVTEIVARYSLAYPEVQFLVHNEGRVALQSAGDGQVTSAVSSLYGAATAKVMVPLDATAASMGIAGLVSPPSETRASRQCISFFVNRRWVQNQFLARALEQAYRDLLPVGRYPVAVLNVFLPPDEVDVNVHPAKREVRFCREAELFALVQRSVRDGLREFVPARTAFAGSGPFVDSPVSRPLQTPPGGFMRAPADFPQQAFSGAGGQLSAAPTEMADAEPLRSQLPILRVVGQMRDTYIIAEGPDGMYLVDQHTAHERVLYEKIKGDKGETGRQGLLDPLVLELSPGQSALMASVSGELARWGFEVEPLDQNACLLRAAPSVLKPARLKEAFEDILSLLEETGGGPAWEERLFQSVACHGAVRAGQTLTPQEMRELLLALEATDLPYTCPHGRPTMVYLSSARLAREFGRG